MTKTNYLGCITVLLSTIWLYSLIPVFRWWSARTHRDLHKFNPILSESCRGIANRTEAWVLLVMNLVLTLPMLIMLYEPNLGMQIGLDNMAQQIRRSRPRDLSRSFSVSPAFWLHFSPCCPSRRHDLLRLSGEGSLSVS